jgi:hypothetical protein
MITIAVVGYVSAFVGECIWLHRYFRRCERTTERDAVETV